MNSALERYYRKSVRFPKLSWVFSKPYRLLAFGLGSGCIRPASGTWGTICGALLAYPLLALPVWLAFILLVIAYIYGVWACSKVGKELGIADHSGIVWDEIVAIAGVYVLMPAHTYLDFLLGFILFRFFDVYKPFPIRQLDAKVHSGQGVMLDDLIAGIYSLFLLYIIKILELF